MKKSTMQPIENVWDYPRPPRLEKVSQHIRVIVNNVVIADSNNSYRILETSHPPTYYIPQENILMEYLTKEHGQSFCEFKGTAEYWTVQVEDTIKLKAAWSYPQPQITYAQLKNHICFYASRVDECYVGDERVQAQEGDFYGGWITSNLKGPFKGAPNTWGW